MVPSALLSKATGTATAMATGRILTTLASSAGVVLVGLLVRHRGLLAVIVGCGIVAVYPDGVLTARTILVEPWLVLFCLLGALALFDRDRLTTSGRRLFWGGVAFGFAGCIEVWAIFPVIVLLVMLLPRIRRAAVYTGGVAVGFLVPGRPVRRPGAQALLSEPVRGPGRPAGRVGPGPDRRPAEQHDRDRQHPSAHPSAPADPGRHGGARHPGRRDDRRGVADAAPGAARAGLVGAGHHRPDRAHVHLA